MLIVKMILQITEFTQEQLGHYLSVSRQTINAWLKGKSISNESITKICDKFGIPEFVFYISLDENIDCYKSIYLTILNNWQDKSKSLEEKKIDNILLEINNKKISRKEILLGLQNGYNPYTKELFDKNHILNDKLVKETLNELKINDNISIKDLDNEQLNKFESLKDWRLNKAKKLGYEKCPYVIISNKSLLNIVKSNVKNKNDLLKINGIGKIKYTNYSDEIYNILINS